MILDIREKTPGEALRLKRRLQRDHTGHAAAVGDVLHDFLNQIGEEGKEMIRAEMLLDDAVDTRTGYRRTIAKVVTPSYAYIETPRYIRTLSEGRTPYYVSAQRARTVGHTPNLLRPTSRPTQIPSRLRPD